MALSLAYHHFIVGAAGRSADWPKTGVGSLTRRANLIGSTTTSIDGLNATDPNGLLVRGTNAGDRSHTTLSWVPEVDPDTWLAPIPTF